MKKRLVRWLGMTLALAAGAYFVYYANRALGGRSLSALIAPRVMEATIILTLLYALLIPTTALAWKWLLRAVGQRVRLRQLLPILATTQFGKYLPGNVAQHIGRATLTRVTGVSLPAVLFSMAYEMLLVVVACAHVSAFTFLWAPPATLTQPNIATYRIPLLIAITVGAIGAIMLAPRMTDWITRYRASRRGDSSHVPPRLHLNLTTAIACYVVYAINFFLVGAGLNWVSRALPDLATSSPDLMFLTGAFAGSWILGFVAPGAPAGLGIREAFLSAWLSGVMPPANVVLLIVALRVATTLGDLLNFLLGSIGLRRALRKAATG